MSRTSTHLLCVFATACIALAPVYAGDLWTTDFEAARKTAAEEKKDLLVLFTGSDWCSWCKKLEQEVFSKQAFKEQAPKDFVLVMLDFPKRKQLPADIKAERDALKTKYGVRGFPTVALLDPAGECYAQTGYRAGGEQEYLKHLTELKGKKGTDKELWTGVEAAQGVDRAKALDAWVRVREELRLDVDQKKIFSEIVELDAKGEAGLRKSYSDHLFMIEIGDQIRALATEKKPDETVALIDKVLGERKDLPIADRQSLYHYKSSTLLSQRKLDLALKAIDEGVALDPKSRGAEGLLYLRRIVQMMKDREEKK